MNQQWMLLVAIGKGIVAALLSDHWQCFTDFDQAPEARLSVNLLDITDEVCNFPDLVRRQGRRDASIQRNVRW